MSFKQFDGWKYLEDELPELLTCFLAFDAETKSVYGAYREEDGEFYQWFAGTDMGKEQPLGFEIEQWCYPPYPEGTA